MVASWTAEDEHDVRACFKALDDDRTEEIDIDRFLTLVLGLGFPKMSRDELLRKLLDSHPGDTVATDHVTVDKVVKVVSKLPRNRDRELRATFDVLSSGRRFITADDLEKLSQELDSTPLSRHEIEVMMEAFDSDKDGKWTLDDFRRLHDTDE